MVVEHSMENRMVEMILGSGLRFHILGDKLVATGNAGLMRKYTLLIKRWKSEIIQALSVPDE